MANTRTFSRSFNGGEVSPEFFGRIDDVKFQMGVAECTNFVVLPHGPVANRGGFELVREVIDSNVRSRLIPFVFSNEQTMVLEFGAGAARFHTQGGTVLNGAAPAEITHPYTAADLFEINYVQSADVLTLVHGRHPPRELRRYGTYDWRLTTVAFTSQTGAPGAPNVVANVPAGATNLRSYSYVVTAIANGEESRASAVGLASNNLDAAGASNTISWAGSGADSYHVYRLEAGVFAFIGRTDQLSFLDEGIMPDVSATPPQARNPFSGTGNYPRAVTYYEQRRAFASTINAPQTIWLTKSGTESNLDVSLPLRQDDAISFRLAARDANTIRHLVPMQALMAMTQSTEWRIDPAGGEFLAPNALAARPQSFVGAASIAPLVVNNNLLFVSARGSHVREFSFSQDAGGYLTGDVSLRAAHLFDGRTIVDSAQSRAPVPVCWYVTSDGLLLGLTYIPEHQVFAWHQHQTDGLFESIAVVAEGDEDVLYAVIRRMVAGQEKRFIERMAPRSAGLFLDAAARYDGAPETVFASGLTHLEDEVVTVVADGAVLPDQRVEGGNLRLDRPASSVIVGRPYVSRLKTLPLVLETPGYAQGRPKAINKVWARLFNTRGGWAGAPGSLYEIKQRTDELMGDTPRPVTGEAELVLGGGYDRDGILVFEQRDPLPMTLLSLTMEAAIAG